MPVGAEWKACWNRRRACSSAWTRSSRSVTSRSRTITPPSVWRGRSTVASTSVVVAPSACGRRNVHRLGRFAARPAASHAVEVGRRARLDELGERHARRASSTGRPVELGGLGVGAAHEPVVVERQHRLGEVVEQQAQLGLGVDQPVDRAVAGGR